MKSLNSFDFFKHINFSFILKILIIFSVVNILIFELRFILKEIDPSPRIKIYFKGVITNPESLYQSSLQLEDAGKLEDSLLDIKLAIGLLDGRNYPSNTRIRYAKRLRYLEQKLELEDFKN